MGITGQYLTSRLRHAGYALACGEWQWRGFGDNLQMHGVNSEGALIFLVLGEMHNVYSDHVQASFFVFDFI